MSFIRAARGWTKTVSETFFFPALLAIIGLKFATGADQVYDIHPADEMLYLSVARSGVLNQSWAPLYVNYLRVFQLFTPDDLKVYYASLVGLGIGLSCLAFLLLRRMGVGNNVALMAAIFILISDANLPLSPKVNHLNIVALGALWLACSYVRSGIAARAALWIGLLPTLYIRQDNLICWGAAGAYFLLGLRGLEGRQKAKILLTALMANGAVFSLLWLRWGNSFGDNRGWFAFRDHYWWRHAHAGERQDVFLWNAFGNSGSIMQAIARDPSTFLSHAWGNFSNLVTAIPDTLLKHVPLFIPDETPTLGGFLIDDLILIGVAVVCWGYSKDAEEPRSRLNPTAKNLFWLLVGSLAIKGLISSLTFSAWTRYHLEIWYFGCLALVLLIGRYKPRSWAWRTSPVLPLAILLLMPTHMGRPPRAIYSSISEVAIRSSRPNLELIRYLRGLPHPAAPTRCLSIGAYGFLLEPQYSCSPALDVPKLAGLGAVREYVDKAGIGLVVADDEFRDLLRQRNISLLVEIEANYEKLGFFRSNGLTNGTLIYSKTKY